MALAEPVGTFNVVREASVLSNLAPDRGHKTDTSETTCTTSRDISPAPECGRFAGETVSRVMARVRA